MEGVLTPEIWIAVAEKTGIKELRRTTRDEPDYDKLMRGRLRILDQHGLKLSDIQQVIGTLRPLEGAREFLDELRSLLQVIILSDTFEQFASPLLRQLGWPTLLCHRLVVENDRIVDYKLRVPEQKQRAVAAFKLLNYHVISAGDSFNDTAMLSEAHVGFLFRAPENVKQQFPAVQSGRGLQRPAEADPRQRWVEYGCPGGATSAPTPFSSCRSLRFEIPRHQIADRLGDVLALVEHGMDLVDHRSDHAGLRAR